MGIFCNCYALRSVFSKRYGFSSFSRFIHLTCSILQTGSRESERSCLAPIASFILLFRAHRNFFPSLKGALCSCLGASKWSLINRDIKQNFDVFVPETNRAITFPLNLFSFKQRYFLIYEKLFVFILHFVHELIRDTI